MADPLIEFDKVVRTYGKGHAEVHALAGVDLQVQRVSSSRSWVQAARASPPP